MTKDITRALLDTYEHEFNASPKNRLAKNAIHKGNMDSVLLNSSLALSTYHTYSLKVEPEGKATNQKSSGRCWLFAALNVMRVPLMKKYKLDVSFEFSQTYLFFYDKFEKANWFLENVIQTMGEDVDGRLFQFLLTNPVQDGGQWDMVVSLVEKYGLVPKTVFPETAHSGNSRRLNWLITRKLREYAFELRHMALKDKKSEADLRATKKGMLSHIHRILTITLGTPPQHFDWRFTDKDKTHHAYPQLTPFTFLREHVSFCAEDHVSLVHDPRNPRGRLYTVAYLGNVVGGREIRYVNCEVDVLKEYTIACIKDHKPVWFGCDVGKFSERKQGILDLDVYDYALGYDIDVLPGNVDGAAGAFDKATRLSYGESLMTHAMVFTGVDMEEGEGSDCKAKPKRWRVENSWGDENGDKGFFAMTDRWFDEYTYQVVVDKKYLSAELVAVLEQTPTVLPAWDPMGSLAQ